MHRARYPASLAPLAGALFSHSSDWSLDPTGSYADYWNLLYSSNSAGWVYKDQNRYLQFSMLAKHYADDPNVGAYVGYDHVLYWQAGVSNVLQYHIYRRYLSGEPLSEAWVEVGTLPGTSVGVTLAGYQSWQETEYEVIAELISGASLKSNRVVTTFPSWQAPRLSFYFSPEPAPGAAVPLGQIVIAWKYDQAPNIWHYRLYRRYFADNGTPTAWSPVGDLERERTSVTLQGYTRTDRFELRLAAVRWNSQEDVSNAIYVRFPTAGDPLRLPY